MVDSRRTLAELIQNHLRSGAEVKLNTAEACTKSVVDAVHLIAETFQKGGKLLLCGNGGSAADCQHIAAEFVSVLRKETPRPGLAALALTTDTSLLTGYANDFGFDGVFARQVEALGKHGDVLLGISTSGDSKNVILAMEKAGALGMRTIALTGQRGRLAAMSDIAITVPSVDTQFIQECHLAIEHALCEAVEHVLFRNVRGGVDKTS